MITKHFADMKMKTGPKETSLEERFFFKVQKTKSCWQWSGAIIKGGYGKIGSGGHNGKTLAAHRVSWELHNGNIPKRMLVLHKCDNRLCVNPAHLFLGSHKDNTLDMMKKGRNSGQAPCLNAGQVMAIRSEYNDFLKFLEKKYNANSQTIYRVIYRKSWANF